jgi:hypothetical protein
MSGITIGELAIRIIHTLDYLIFLFRGILWLALLLWYSTLYLVHYIQIIIK